jgi:AcrR family transcriptional regulator
MGDMAAAATTAASRSTGQSVGRRRDPTIEPKVFAAALRVYAAEGWGGFSFDSVAREAGVGKPAMYRRWERPEELLVRAFSEVHFPTARDCGSLKADLTDYALQWAEWYADPVTVNVGLRILPDCEGNPDLAAIYDKIINRPKRRAAKAIGRRAIERGELNEDVPVMAVIDLLIGGLQLHWIYARPRERSLRSLSAYAKTLIDIILTGALRQPESLEFALAETLGLEASRDPAIPVAAVRHP